MSSLVLLVVLLCLNAAQAATSNSSASSSSISVHWAPRQTISPDLIASIGAYRSVELAKRKIHNPQPQLPLQLPKTLTKHANVSAEAIQQARALVAAAHESQAAYNLYQASNPRRNTFLSKKSTAARAAKIKRAEDAVVQPVHSEEVMDAVRLLGDVDASAKALNGTLLKQYPPHNNTVDQSLRSDGKLQARGKLEARVENDHFWMANMDHLGTQPFGGDSSYKVWRSVADYGAYGDGVTDDTAAINKAIADGNRCGQNCLSSSIKAAVIYFPLGTYRITSSIIIYHNTQIVGYIGLGFSPTLVVDPNFTGFGVLTSDIYLHDENSEWYIEQSNFYRQIRNFNIDLTSAKLEGINGIHWQVAQATSISNVYFCMSDKATSTQIGIFAENGSGGWMSDLVFEGGKWGILGGNQQYTVRGALFVSCANAIGMIWDWSWTWSQLSINSCDVGINLHALGSSAGDAVGSVYLMDSIFTNTPTMIYTDPWLATEQGNSMVTLDNIQMSGVDYVFGFSNGHVSTIPTNSPIEFMTVDNVDLNGDYYGELNINVGTRPTTLVSRSGEFHAQEFWFSRSKPSYNTYDASQFFNVKWIAAGDGVTDDTASIQAIFDYCSGFDCIVFFPAGSYIITSTIFISIDTYIVGEAWAQIVASGPVFANASRPTAAIVVGEDGDPLGSVEIQDLLFTSIGNLPGLVLMVWNAKSSTIGSCAMWDSHFRVGGARGTNLQVTECPILSGGINSKCVAAFAMFVVQTTGYFENVWAWVADHDIDDSENTQVDIYGGRGIMVLGDGPNWFWGTASEHNVLYQYSLINASNVFMSMIQTKSPYFQGSANTQAPLPFDQAVDFPGDPSWDDCGSATTSCNMAWALVVESSSDIFINGAGLYSWFQNYNEACVHTRDCQQKMIYVYNSANLWLNHVITIGAVEMITPALGNDVNEIVLAAANLQANLYPWWSAVAMYLASTSDIDTTVQPAPVKVGWVAFGDSYAAGIGAGNPDDVPDKDGCYRGDGGYPWYLNKYFLILAPRLLYFRPYACFGAIATDVTTKQLVEWRMPSNSELATISITWNDLKFADVIKTCVVGKDRYRTCDAVLSASEAIIDKDNTELDKRLYDVWHGIFKKATNPRFVIYQTGYPQFFEALDRTCDSSRFYAGSVYLSISYGEWMTIPLRDRMNALSWALNNKLRSLIARWNAGLPRPQIVFVEPDVDFYPSHRFCEPGIKEPLYGDNEKTVAFFYPNGQDIGPGPRDIDTGDEGKWPTKTYSSANCESLGLDWADSILCDTAVAVAALGNATVVAESVLAAEQAFKNSGDTMSISVATDGSVVVTDEDVKWLKMFHPKSKYNQQIALDILLAVARRGTSA